MTTDSSGDLLPRPGTALLSPGLPFTRHELQAMALDGLLDHVWGDAWVPRGEPVTASVRADALALPLSERLRERAVLGRMTAAWVYGCAPPPARLQVLIDPAHRTTSRTPFSPVVVHEVALGPADARRIGDVLVTTPLRTALDVAVHEDNPVPVLRRIAEDGELNCPLLLVRAVLQARRRLPGKARALQHLAEAMTATPPIRRGAGQTLPD